MPITVTIPPRNISRTADIEEILELWDECELSILPEEERQRIRDESNIKKLKGNLAYIKRWFDKHDIHITDAGQNILLKELTLQLDFRAYHLYTSFNYFLNDVAIQIGKDPTMDAGISNSKKPINEPYALIKTILLRMVLKILHNKGSKEEKSQNHEKVFNKFMEKLTNTGINLNQGWISWFNGEVASKFSNSFLSKKNDWSNKINSMVGEVALINIVKNVVESNLESLIKLQLHTARFLYLRLLNALNVKITLEERDYFNDDWIIRNLPDTEQKIMNLNPQKEISLLRNNDEICSGIHLSKDKLDTIINQLKELKELNKIKITDSEIIIIQDLYKALYNLTFIMDIVGSVDTLTTFTGCLPFLMKYINAQELGRYIKKYRNACLKACTAKDLENTIIHTIISNENNFLIQPLAFDTLEDQKILEPMSDSIMGIFIHLTMRCKTHECDSIINEKNQFILPVDTKKLPDTDKRHTKFLTTKEEPKNTLLECLDFKYDDLLKLLNYLRDDKNNSWKHIGQEAYITLQNKKLPHRLRYLVRNIFDVVKYKETFEKLENLADELRDVFMEYNLDMVPKSDIDLIEFANKQQVKYLDKYRERIKNCKDGIGQCSLLLAMATTKDKSFVLAYFQYKYLDKKSDLEYIPNLPTTIQAIAEYKQWKIIISKDESNSAKDPVEIIHIDYVSNTPTRKPSIPQITLPEPVVTERKNPEKVVDAENKQAPVVNNDKKELDNLIFEAMQTLSNEQKKNLLDYFRTDDPLLASLGWTAATNLVEDAKKSIQSFHEKRKNLEGCLILAAKRNIINTILTYIDEEKPSAINSEFIKKKKKQLEDSISDYMDNHLHIEYQKISRELKLESVIRSNDTSLLLLQKRNPITHQEDFLAFLQDPLCFYMKNDNGEYVSFSATKGAGDGNCSLTALDINERSEFIAALREALKNPQTRNKSLALLGMEIRNDFDGKNGIQGIHDQNEWLDLYDKYHSLCLEADSLKRLINARGFHCKGTAKDLITYLNRPEIQPVITEEDMNLLHALAKIVTNINESETDLMEYCADQARIDIYLEKLSVDKCWIGKYALHVYARQKKFCLSIYDKQNAKQFQEIKLDKKTSLDLQYPANNKKAHIVFINGNHFDKLQPINELAPKPLANNYLAYLSDNINMELSDFCIPKSNQSPDEYINNLKEQDKIISNEVTLAPEEAKQYNANLALIESSLKWAELLKTRDSIYKQMENQLGSHFPKITKLKDKMVLIDEPRDNNNRSLLQHFIEKEIVEETDDMIDFLLGKGASVVLQNGNAQDFKVTIAKPDNECKYVLEKDDNNLWILKYYEKVSTKPAMIQTDNIPGLKELLQNAKNFDNEELSRRCTILLLPYHEKMRTKTPLSFAGRNMGFYHENPMFYKLLSCAFKEALTESNKILGSDFPILYHFTAKFIPAILEHLDGYAAMVKRERRESFWYRWGVDSFPRENQARAKDLALIYESVIHALKTHEYKDMLLTIRTMKENAASVSGSKLYLNLDEILKMAASWLNDNLPQFNEEFKRYEMISDKNQNKVSFSDEDKKLDDELDSMENAELRQQIKILRRELEYFKKNTNKSDGNTLNARGINKNTESFSCTSKAGIFSVKSNSKNANPDITQSNINSGPGHA